MAPYSQTVVVWGGTGPLTFSVSSGALPTGLTLNANTGVISGVAKKWDYFSFVVTVTDATGAQNFEGYSQWVHAGAPAAMSVFPDPSSSGFAFACTIQDAYGNVVDYTLPLSNSSSDPQASLTAWLVTPQGVPFVGGTGGFDLGLSTPGKQWVDIHAGPLTLRLNFTVSIDGKIYTLDPNGVLWYYQGQWIDLDNNGTES